MNVSKHLLAIDPGIRGCGVAVYTPHGLRWAGYVKNPASGDTAEACLALARAVEDAAVDEGQLPVIGEIAFEWPRVYTIGKGKGDPNDLLPLVGVCMALCGRLFGSPATRYYPHEWKGQMQKGAAFVARVQSRLTPEELGRVHARGHLGHNVWDAVGIGLHHLGRFERKRIIAR